MKREPKKLMNIYSVNSRRFVQSKWLIVSWRSMKRNKFIGRRSSIPFQMTTRLKSSSPTPKSRKTRPSFLHGTEKQEKTWRRKNCFVFFKDKSIANQFGFLHPEILLSNGCESAHEIERKYLPVILIENEHFDVFFLYWKENFISAKRERKTKQNERKSSARRNIYTYHSFDSRLFCSIDAENLFRFELKFSFCSTWVLLRKFWLSSILYDPSSRFRYLIKA